MDQRHQRPGILGLDQPFRQLRDFALMLDPAARLVERDDEVVLFEQAGQQMLARHCGDGNGRPVPARGEFQLGFLVGH